MAVIPCPARNSGVSLRGAHPLALTRKVFRPYCPSTEGRIAADAVHHRFGHAQYGIGGDGGSMAEPPRASVLAPA